jgi:hypothetical protein
VRAAGGAHGATEGARGSWRIFVPWAVLPLALAVIALVDWLKHHHTRAQREEAE